MRLKIIRYIIIGLFCVIVLDLFYVQAVRGRYFNHLSQNNMIRVVPLEGWRGRIYDRNGNIFADNKVSHNVAITAQETNDIDAIFVFLSDVLKISKIKLIRIYQQKKTAPFIPVVVAENISNEQAIIIEENKYRFPGLLVQKGYKRLYPLKENSAHVLGHVSRINRSKIEKFKEYGFSPQSIVGYLGVEEYYDSYLRGEDGGLQVEVNSRGKQVRLLSLKEASKGQDIVLTLDKDIQKIAMDVLDDNIGSIVVMDNNNGEILGMVNTPSFDPNIFVDTDSRGKIQRLFANSNAPLLNRAISGLYPPGSVFKVPVAIAGFDTGTIDRRTTYICHGEYELGGTVFGCTHVHGSQNLIESIAHSCNIYYYHLGLKLGADQIYQFARLLGLGGLTNVDLPFEKPGSIPSRQKGRFSKQKKWYTGNTLNMSIGQGDVLTTPLQLVRMIATVARDGVEIQPHLVYSIGGYRVDQFDIQRKIDIKQSAFKEVKKGLRAAVADYSGTAHVLDIKEVYIAGKTGTAQTTKDKEHHAWFVGYARGEKRNISFCVFLEHGGSSLNACLLAKKLILKLYQTQKL